MFINQKNNPKKHIKPKKKHKDVCMKFKKWMHGPVFKKKKNTYHLYECETVELYKKINDILWMTWE